jgi:hypothetical protein
MLEKLVHPPDEIMDYWRATFTLRKLMLENPNFPTSEYFKRFPCLSAHDGLNYVSPIIIINDREDRLYPCRGLVKAKLNKFAKIPHSITCYNFITQLSH